MFISETTTTGAQMQVGDLVELSAYGNSLKHNTYVVGKLGLVIREPGDLVPNSWPRANMFKVEWIGTRISVWRYDRRELKYAKNESR